MIRYPGSKDKIVDQIVAHFPDACRLGGLFGTTPDMGFQYREPFFGAGAIGMDVLARLSPWDTAWINDRDQGLVCLWQAVYHEPERLCEMIRAFRPSVEAFYQFREDDARRGRDPVLAGFQKLALHQTSFSGLGAMAGGPIGGRQQSSAYNVECRWNESRLCRVVMAHYHTMRRLAHVEITCRDFSALVLDAPASAFIYADPPYVAKGPELYKHAMSDADHQRLARLLQACRAPWVLSYDEHPMIRDLYAWAAIGSVELTYTTAIADGPRRKNAEVLITPAA